MRKSKYLRTSYDIAWRRLNEKDAWNTHESATDKYSPADFPMADWSPTHQPGESRLSAWRPFVAGVVAVLFAWFAGSYFAQAELYVGFYSGFGIVALATLVVYIGYICTLFSSSPSTPAPSQPSAAKAQFVIPGWTQFHFVMGVDGIAVDGKQFLYFFEWADVKTVKQYRNKLVLTHTGNYFLVVPSRFFRNKQGKEIDWDTLVATVKSSTPPHAIWTNVD